MTSDPPATRDPAGRHAPPRIAHLDAIRACVVAGVIVVHTAITFGATGDWYLAGLDEHLTGVGDVVLSLVVIAGAMVGMGLLFLVAGLLTEPALARKGSRRFLCERVVRLGLPTLVFVVAVSPPLEYLKYVTDGGSGGVSAFLRTPGWEGAPGPLWFLEALLAFSLAYVAVRAAVLRRRTARAIPPVADANPLGAHHVATVVGLIAILSFAARLGLPLDSEQMHLRLAVFPQYAVLFGFGIVAARRGWLHAGSRRRERACARVTAAASVLLPMILVTGGGVGQGSPLLGGPHWQALTVAGDEAVLATCASLWVVERSRRFRWERPFARAATAASYGAYLAHAPVIVLLALAIHELPGPAELKFALAAPTGVAISFGVAWAVARRRQLRAVAWATRPSMRAPARSHV